MPKIDLYTLLDLVGHLDDNSGPDSASTRFRRYIEKNIQSVNDVRSYVNDALTQSGDQYNKALQDLINHIGQLLGFNVTYGRYRGVRGEIGFDGLWRSSMRMTIVVEAKTTDVYSVKTAPVLGYINALVSEGQIISTTNALGLYVYGRFDAATSQLENAIIVEGRREQLRVVSVQALVKILELKEEYNLAHNTILGLLLPAPVKVDAIVNLIFDIVAEEKEEFEDSPPELEKEIEALEETAEEEVETEERKTRSNLVSINESYTGKTPISIVLLGQQFEVHTWKEVGLTVFNVALMQHPVAFTDAAITITGRKRPYITVEKDKLRKPEIIPGTNLYFETNLSANSMVRLCYTLLANLGHSYSDLRIETDD